MSIIKDEFLDIKEKGAVLSLLFSKSDKASKYALLDYFTITEPKEANFNITIGAVLPSPLVYFAYEGSKTIPDCSETVNWYVVQESIPIEATQLAAFTAKFQGNSTFAAGRGNNRSI